jgi:ABC-type uncharacterized transport system substrate-binding protein
MFARAYSTQSRAVSCRSDVAAWGIRLLCALVLLIVTTCVRANTVVILTPSQGLGYEELIDPLREDILRNPGLKVQILASNSGTAPGALRLPDDTVLVVTVGLQAAQSLLALVDMRMPVLSVLLPRSSFEAISNTSRSSRKHSAIFIDQPPNRQLDLLRSVMPLARTIGLVFGPGTQQDIPAYKMLTANRGLSLVAERAERETELYPVLQSVLRSSDVLLAIPDTSIVNASTSQNLLLTSFRFRVPVIGYSASYVRAGALAAVYSTPRQIGVEAGPVVRQFLRSGNLPAAKYPRSFTVTVNRQMADSLGLIVPEDAAIVQRLQQLEGIE